MATVRHTRRGLTREEQRAELAKQQGGTTREQRNASVEPTRLVSAAKGVTPTPAPGRITPTNPGIQPTNPGARFPRGPIRPVIQPTQPGGSDPGRGQYGPTRHGPPDRITPTPKPPERIGQPGMPTRGPVYKEVTPTPRPGLDLNNLTTLGGPVPGPVRGPGRGYLRLDQKERDADPQTDRTERRRRSANQEPPELNTEPRAEPGSIDRAEARRRRRGARIVRTE